MRYICHAYASIKNWIIHTLGLFMTAVINGYLSINIFFPPAIFNVATELRIYLLTSWRGIQQFNEKHGQNEKEFEWLRGINVSSALDRNELIFHRASKRRCIDAKNSEGRLKHTRRIFPNKVALWKLEAQMYDTPRHPKSGYEGKILRSLRRGSKRCLLTRKQESGGIIMGVPAAILLAYLDRCSGAFTRAFTWHVYTKTETKSQSLLQTIEDMVFENGPRSLWWSLNFDLPDMRNVSSWNSSL